MSVFCPLGKEEEQNGDAFCLATYLAIWLVLTGTDMASFLKPK